MVGKPNVDNSKSGNRKKTCKRVALLLAPIQIMLLLTPALSRAAPQFHPQSKFIWQSTVPNGDTNKHKENKEPPNEKPVVSAKMLQYVDVTHCLAVAKSLFETYSVYGSFRQRRYDVALIQGDVKSRYDAKIQLIDNVDPYSLGANELNRNSKFFCQL
ncbi:hypothetical protein NQ317_019336 [Molorchus minor]|uniref:Uncharacterized protein n=1 Tax=Molorchus minor TaxID=1323400 RepID=A0ABQ9J0E6_9CUCU|nr:hypothetical protein NQ317_019336 [Molorchus minor]